MAKSSQFKMPALVVDNQMQGTNPGVVEDPMSDTPTRAEMDAKLGQISAETDTKIARIDGKLDLLLSKMGEVVESGRATRANQWVIATALAVIMVALGFGIPALFGNGLQLRDVIHNEVVESLPKVAPAPAVIPPPKTPKAPKAP